MGRQPLMRISFVRRAACLGRLGQMLTRVIEINGLGR